MNALPFKARVYIVAIVLTGFGLFAYSQIFERSNVAGWEVLVFLVLSLVAGGTKIMLSPRHQKDEGGTMSLGFAIALATLLKCGPAAAVVVNAGGTLWSCLYPKRMAPHHLIFNVSLGVIEATLGGMVYVALMPAHIGNLVQLFIAVSATALTYYAVNTFAVSTVIGLCTSKSPLSIWQKHFQWTAPSYLATACVTALAMKFCGESFFALLLFVVPIAYLVYHSYVTYVSRAVEKERHIEELEVSKASLAELYLATIKSLALAIDAKDQYTHQHILRVQRYAVAIANQMQLSGAELEAVNTGALLHDIGKLGVPEYVLMKPGRLTPEEFDKIKKHPEIGEAILDPVEFPWPVLPVVRSHHEKWDGTGYPDGLKGEEIPLTARIMAVADVYDALTSSRSYRKAWTHERARDTIQKDAGTHFDPQVVEAFLVIIDDLVKEMADEGQGPLAIEPPVERESQTKAKQAAEHISRASTELLALYEVAQSLSSSLGTQDTVEFLCRKMENIFPGSLCLFMIADPSGTGLVSGAAMGLNSDYFQQCRTIGPETTSCLALREGQTYVGEYDGDDLMLANPESAIWIPLLSCMIVPIVFEGQGLGTINCYHPDLLEMIAERAAPSLYNSLQFERNRTHTLTDPLTGAFNLRHVTETIDGLCTDENSKFAVLCMDLDSFKPINDNFGHQKGDEVLRELTKVFASEIESEDILGRYGGDEFLIILTNADEGKAAAIAKRLGDAVEHFDPGLYHTMLGHLKLGISIGYSCYPQDGTDCATLVAAADAHMYRMKMERKLRTLASRPNNTELKEAS
jgi:diguanylate cyclase (GGDEF)-like protein/putative nucleotidyltransferase with HDIG domain